MICSGKVISSFFPRSVGNELYFHCFNFAIWPIYNLAEIKSNGNCNLI